MIDEKKLIEEIQGRQKYYESKAAEYDEAGERYEYLMDVCNGKATELTATLSIINEQPKVAEWIPCSERLPETDDVVLITVFNIDNNKLFVTPAVYQHPFFCTWNTLAPEDKVIAWQPLPEPWEGEE